MNTDKENVNRMRATSRIPVPLDPLPALSENILKKIRNNDSLQRPPLKTINNHPNIVSSVGPAKKTRKELIEPQCQTIHLQLDTRHVTIRQRDEELDWDYKVFKDKSQQDNNKETTVIVISDDDNHTTQNDDQEKRNETNYSAKIIQRSGLREGRKIATPALKSLEPNRVRNIKRSLKRPHSRELLQGVSSIAKEDKGCDEEQQRLNYNNRMRENAIILQSSDFFNKSYMKGLSWEYTSDIFLYLLSVEDKSIMPHIASVTRACVINWLMKVNGPGGDPTTVQTACWYLDAVLAVGYVEVDNLQLVATACYWISQKLHGPAVYASRLVKCANRAFRAEQLTATEKAILKKLKFPRQPVVPQDYIPYMSWCCDNAQYREIEMAATFLCMAGVMVNRRLCEEYPSVIGAAAVRNALLLLKRTDLMKRLQMCSVFKEAEKKSGNMSFVCSVQRKAVRMVSNPSYQYKAAYEQYGCGPLYIAQKVVTAANDMGTTIHIAATGDNAN